MRYLAVFIRQAGLSVTRPAFYTEALAKSFWAGCWYLFLLLMVLDCVPVITHLSIIHTANTSTAAFIEGIKADAYTIYPAGLVVTVKNGEVSTNVQEPYYIDMPARWTKALEDSKNASSSTAQIDLQHLVAIDTAGTAENFSHYQSLVLITKHSVVVPDKNGSVRIQTIQPTANVTVTKAQFDEIVGAILPYADYVPKIVKIAVPVLLALFPFVAASFEISSQMIYLLFTSLLLLALASVLKKPLSYGQIYTLSFYGLTLPLLVDAVMRACDSYTPYVFTVVFLLWMAAVIGKFNSAKVEPMVQGHVQQ